MANINGILLENGAMYLSEDELIEIKTQLKEYGMDLQIISIAAPRASLNDINIFISQNITELIITGLIIPTAYKVLKKTLMLAVHKIIEKIKILQSGKIREAQPSIHFKTQNGEIIAPIPKDLTDDQFNKYFDSINEAMKTIQCNPTEKYECFIIERITDSIRVEVKKMLKYAQEQCEKQNEKNRGH